MDVESLKEFIKAQDQRTAQLALKRATSSTKRLQSHLEQVGVEVPDPQPSFIQEFFDTLDTGGQFARGVIAKLIGEEGYADQGFIDAGMKGTREDLVVGDLLRKNDVLTDSPITRGVTGFIGDVLTDPLTYLTFGGGIGTRIGGKAVSKTPLKLADGTVKTATELAKGRRATLLGERLAKVAGAESSDDILRALSFDSVDELLQIKKPDQLLDAIKSFGGDVASKSDKELIGDIIKAQSTAAKGAAAPFRTLDATLRNLTKVERAGKDLKKLGIDVPVNMLKGQVDDIKNMFGLAPDQAVEDIFLRPAMRYSNPLASIFGLPDKGLFSRSAEIPFLTSGSEKLFKALGGPLYNANLKVGKVASKAIEQMEKVPGLRYPAKMMGLIGKLPKNLSVRVQAGGAGPRNILEEYQVATGYAAAEADNFMRARFEKLDSLIPDDMHDTVYRDMQRTFDEIAHVPDASKEGLSADAIVDLINGKAEEGFRAVRNKVEAIAPGAGELAEETMRLTQKNVREWRAVEKKLGLGDSVIDNYIRRAYERGGPVGTRQELDKEIIEFQNKADTFKQTKKNVGSVASHNKERKYDTLGAALTERGLVPKFNYKEAVRERMMSHRMATAEADFYQRMAHEVAIPKDTIRKVEALVGSKNAKLADAAMEFLRQTDVDPGFASRQATAFVTAKGLSKDVAKEAARHGIKRFRHADYFNGEFLTKEIYDELREQVALKNPDAIKAAKKFGLRFDREDEARIVEKMSNLYKEFQQGVIGRAGEDVYTRAGSVPTNTAVRSRIINSPSVPEVTKQWMQGVVPRSFNNAFADAFQTESLAESMVNSLRSKGAGELADVVEGFTGTAKKWVSMLKLGSTIFWPAYHLRNFTQAQVLGVQEAAILGEQFNPMRFAETFMIRKGKGYLKAVDGSILPASQLVDEARRYGVINEDFLKSLDIMKTQKEMLTEAEKAVGPVSEALRKGTKIPREALKAFSDKGLQFSSLIENYGREHLFFALRKAGNDPQTAADLTNKIMVNYARGKTRFERDLLNNVFFFYSFARASTANQLKALVTRPGALTTQLHFVDGVKEVLMDPEQTPLPQDTLNELQTIRGAETLSRFLRMSEDGNPVFLQNVGIPVEESARFFNFRMPETFTMNDFINAGLEGSQRTAQTIISQVNPLIKGPLEIMIGRNLFFDRPLDDKFLTKIPKLADNLPRLSELTFGMVPPDKMPEGFFKGLDKTTQTFLDARDNGDGTFRANPIRLAIVAAMIPGLERARTTSRAFFNEDTPLSERATRLFLGMKTQEVKPEQAKGFAEWQRVREIAKKEGVDTKKSFMRRLLIDASKEE